MNYVEFIAKAVPIVMGHMRFMREWGHFCGVCVCDGIFHKMPGDCEVISLCLNTSH